VVLTVGCTGARKLHPVTTVPVFQYPNQPEGDNLHLVSLYHDLAGDRFVQGLPGADSARAESVGLPVAVVRGDDGSLDILDRAGGAVWRLRFDSQGAPVSIVKCGPDRDRFVSAQDMARGPDGRLWVTDSARATVSIFDDGETPDLVIDGVFARPVGITWHPGLQRMLVTDLVDNAIALFRADGTLDHIVNEESGLAIEVPSFVAVGPLGRIYVVEALASRVHVLDENWHDVLSFGDHGDGPGFFAKPKGIAVDADGRVYVVDALFDNVQIFNAQGALLLTLGTTGTGVAEFWQPAGITVGPDGAVYIADTYNHRLQVYGWEGAGS